VAAAAPRAALEAAAPLELEKALHVAARHFHRDRWLDPLESEILPELEVVLGPFALPPDVLNEVRQLVRVKLLVANHRDRLARKRALWALIERSVTALLPAMEQHGPRLSVMVRSLATPGG